MIKWILERAPLTLLFIGYALGILTGYYTQLSFAFWWGLTLACFSLELVLPARCKSFVLILLLLLCLGGMNLTRQNHFPANHLTHYPRIQHSEHVRGRVIRSQLRADESLKLWLDNVHIHRQEWIPVEGSLLLTIKQNHKTYLYADTILFRAQIFHPKGQRNPGEFDYRQYLHHHGVYATVYIDNSAELNRFPYQGFSIRRLANQMKHRILGQIDQAVSGEQNAILKALIVGVRGEITAETRQAFIDSGIIHVLAVSGLHVGYVTLVFWVIFGFLRLPRRSKVLLTILALGFYALMVDLKPSVTRAVIMAAMILFSQAWEKRVNIYNSLAAAALIQTLFDPLLLFDLGFQLSFTAVLSIVYIHGRLLILLPEKFNPTRIKKGLFRNTYQLLLVSLAALLGTLPLTIYYFQRVPLISLIANLFAIPLVGLIGALGFAQVILGFIWSGFNIIYGQVQMVLIGLLKLLIGVTADIPCAYFPVKSISVITLLIGYVLLLGMLNSDKGRIRAGTLIGFLLIINFWIWNKAFQPAQLKIIFFDVGQGDAAYIEFPSGKNMLVDAGAKTYSKNYAQWMIAPHLKRNRIKRLDILLLTHPHNDHIGGAPYLMRHFEIGELWESDVEAHSRVFRTIRFLADSLRIPIRKCYAGDYSQMDRLTSLYMLHPSRRFIATHPRGYNDYSLTFKLSFQEQDILFTGDIETLSEGYLNLYNDFIACEVLKVPHHGSPTSSTLNFIQTVGPQCAVISVGEGNKFNHPSAAVCARYDSLTRLVHRTDLCGALILQTNGKNMQLHPMVVPSESNQ